MCEFVEGFVYSDHVYRVRFNRGLPLSCGRCGRVFVVGERVKSYGSVGKRKLVHLDCFEKMLIHSKKGKETY